MKRLLLFVLALSASCYNPNKPPACDPSTIDWPRCVDPTQPKLGSSLIYPGNTVYPTSIFGSTAAGRAMLTAADAAAQRTLLGIQDVGDLRNYAIARAISLLSLSNPTVVVDESFVAKPGSSPSFFAGTSTNVSTLSGGWKKIAAGAVSGNSNAWTQADVSTAGTVSNVGTQKWYQLWVIKLDAAADSTAQVQFGWINTAFSVVQPLVGMQGASSTTKFRFFDGTTGATSTVNLDTGVHIIEHWGDGAAHINASVDGETAATYTTAKTDHVTPFVQVVTGSGGAQSASLGHLIIITPQS